MMSLFSFGENCQTVFQRWLCKGREQLPARETPVWLASLKDMFLAQGSFKMHLEGMSLAGGGS